jgi:hypothetical protein
LSDCFASAADLGTIAEVMIKWQSRYKPVLCNIYWQTEAQKGHSEFEKDPLQRVFAKKQQHFSLQLTEKTQSRAVQPLRPKHLSFELPSLLQPMQMSQLLGVKQENVAAYYPYSLSELFRYLF